MEYNLIKVSILYLIFNKYYINDFKGLVIRMNNRKELFKKMPMAMLYINYNFLECNVLKIKIQFATEKALLLLNIDNNDISNEDFFSILPEFKDCINFSEIQLSDDKVNLEYTRYIKKLTDFIKITIQKIDNEHAIFYLESCVDKYFLEDIKQKDKIFFIKNANNKYVDGSEKFKILSMCKNDDIYGLTDIDLYGKELGEKYMESTNEFIYGDKAYSCKLATLNSKVYMLHRYGIYSNNKTMGIIGVFESISGKMEKVSDENILTGTVNNIHDHIYYKDINGVYLDCNDSFLNDLNLKREEVIGRDTSSIPKLKDINENTIKSDLEVITEGKRKIYNEEVCINGKVKEFEIIKEPLWDSYGNIVGIIAIGRDVSHRREIERLKSEFFANLSHELRTPLNLIFSSLQVIRSTEKELLGKSERLNRYTNIISQNSKRLLKLVNNLIDSTRFDCGYYEYSPKNENIVQFIENISMSVAEFAMQNDIILTFDTNVEEKIMAFDLEKLERTMLNLLSNSIKYNNRPGKIEVILNDCGETFNITVKDTGIGIPSNKLKVIFERFKQVEDRLRKRSEGSGIGLSLVKDLVNIQGGTIDVKSELGVGSEFTVKLPAKILSNNSTFNDSYYEDVSNGLVTRMNIEFSDIYI